MPDRLVGMTSAGKVTHGCGDHTTCTVKIPKHAATGDDTEINIGITSGQGTGSSSDCYAVVGRQDEVIQGQIANQDKSGTAGVVVEMFGQGYEPSYEATTGQDGRPRARCAEWGSRLAVHDSQSGVRVAANADMPHWAGVLRRRTYRESEFGVRSGADAVRLALAGVLVACTLGISLPATAAADVPAGLAATTFEGGAENIVFSVAPDNGIDELTYVNGAWTSPVEIAGTAGTATSAPAVDVFRGGAEIDLWYRGPANELRELFYRDATGWSKSITVPDTTGMLASAPTADVFRDDSEVDVFYETTGGALGESFYTAKRGWSSVLGVPGTAGIIDSAPAAAVYDDGQQVIVFYQGTDDSLHQSSFAASSGWRSLEVPETGLQDQSAPAVDVFRNGTEADIWYAGPGGGIEQSYYVSGSGWAGAPRAIPGAPAATGSPAADVFDNSAQVDVFFRDGSGAIHQSTYARGTGWQNLTVPGTTPPPAPVVGQPPPQPTPQPIPLGSGQSLPSSTVLAPHRKGRRVDLYLRATWTFTRHGRPLTQLQGIKIGHFPADARIAVSCTGKACPFKVRHTRRAGLSRFWRRLEHVSYLAGERLHLTISRPNHPSERAVTLIRARAKPVMHLVTARPKSPRRRGPRTVGGEDQWTTRTTAQRASSERCPCSSPRAPAAKWF